MCLDFPGRVVARDGVLALVETEGRRRHASTLLFPDLAVGEWVYVTAGTVIERMAAAEARQIAQLLHVARGDPS